MSAIKCLTTPFLHSKIKYLQVNFEPPVFERGNYLGMQDPGEHDKARILLAVIELAEVRNFDYIMSVDSDDLVSSKLAAFVDQNKFKNKAGWYFESGYLYVEGRNFLILDKKSFNKLYGSCPI